MGVHRRPVAPAEPDEGHPGLLRQVHGERRRGAHRRHHGDPGHRRLLHELERRPARHLQDGPPQRQPALAQRPAHDLVHGVVPAHVLAQAQQLAGGGEQSRRVHPARLAEQSLVVEESLGERQQHLGVDERFDRLGREVGRAPHLVDRVHAAHPAGAAHRGGPGGPGRRDIRREGHREGVVILLGPTADGGAVADLGQVIAVPYRPLGDQVSGGEIHVVARGAHRDDERLAADPDLERLLDGEGRHLPPRVTPGQNPLRPVTSRPSSHNRAA